MIGCPVATQMAARIYTVAFDRFEAASTRRPQTISPLPEFRSVSETRTAALQSGRTGQKSAHLSFIIHGPHQMSREGHESQE